MRKRRTTLGLLRGVLIPCGAALALLCFASALNGLDQGRAEEDLKQLETAVRRGCVACYAAEGIYPPDLEYLKDRYGVQVDDEKYIVHYEAIAENLMPDIAVLER